MPSTKAEKRAQSLLQELGIRKPPIPVEDIARTLGAIVAYKPLDGPISGMTFRDANRKVIGINARHPRVRQRFTLAHEIGHLLLHQGKPLIIDRDVRVNLRDATSELAIDTEEIEANRFAAELLMPRDLLLSATERHLRQAGESRSLTTGLAELFDVSKQAMEIRLINLGLRKTS